MQCRRCGQSFEGAWCPRCEAPAWAPMSPQQCARCGAGFLGGSCPRCGPPSSWSSKPRPPQPPDPGPPLGVLLAILWTVAFLAFAVLAVISLILLIDASTQIVPGILAENPTGCVGPQNSRIPCAAYLATIAPFPIPTSGGDYAVVLGLVAVQGLPLLAWFFVVVAIILASVLLLIWQEGGRGLRELREATQRWRAPLARGGAWSSLAQVFAAIFFFETLYIIILLPLLGVSPQAPFPEGEEPWYIPLLLANAPVYEELLLRVLILGLLVWVLEKDAGLPKLKLRHLVLGGRYEVNVRTAGPLLYSSVLFALAHVLGAGNWAPWKVVDTFVAGLALGYLFLRHGLAASILLHFTIDYGPEQLGPQANVFDPWNLAFIALNVVGAACFLLYVYRTSFYLRRAYRRLPALIVALSSRLPRARPAQPVPMALPLPPPPPDLVAPAATGRPCANCGAYGVRYEAGRLVCPHCGAGG